MKKVVLIALAALVFTACKKDTKASEPEDPTPAPSTNNCPAASCVTPLTSWPMTGSGPFLIFKFKFDSTQVRLNNLGMPATVPSTNEACSPIFNSMSSHYIELAQTSITGVGSGKVLFYAAETNCQGGENAITYCQSVVVKEDSVFFAIPISSVTPGSYQTLRVSLAYQNYDIPFTSPSTGPQWGTIASFIGFRTYLTQYKVKTQTIVPTESLSTSPDGTTGGNFKQGYWGFETTINGFPWTSDGKSAGTTVVNPASISLPPGSCLVSGDFYDTASSTNSPLVITGNETQNKTIIVSLSTNKSFEWKLSGSPNGRFEPAAGEFPVDMGIRGMIPKY